MQTTLPGTGPVVPSRPELIAAITRDPALQVRAALDEATVRRYAELMHDGVPMDPAIAYQVGDDLLLVDGWHRVAAAESLGATHIDLLVHYGTRTDALRAAVAANQKHGLAMSSKDKRRAVELLLEDAELRALPVRELAALAAVSHSLVAKLRQPYDEAEAEERAKAKATNDPVAGVVRHDPPENLSDKDKRRWVILDLLWQHAQYLRPNDGLERDELVAATGYPRATLSRVLTGMIKSALIAEDADGRFAIRHPGERFLGTVAQVEGATGAEAASNARDRAVAAAADPSPCLADQIRKWTDDQVGMAAARLADQLLAAPWTIGELGDLVQDYLLPDAEAIAHEVAADRIDEWLSGLEYIEVAQKATTARGLDKWALTEKGQEWAISAADLFRSAAPEGSPTVTPPHRPEEVPEVTNPRKPTAEPLPPENQTQVHSVSPMRMAFAQLLEDHGARAPITTQRACAIAYVMGLDGTPGRSYEDVLARESVFADFVRETLVDHLRDRFVSMKGMPTLPHLADWYGIDMADVKRLAEAKGGE